MKFGFIFDHRETFEVGCMCNVLSVSRSGYYAWSKRPQSQRSTENRELQDKIRVLHAASHGIYGAPKIHKDLVDAGISCGKNRVARIMRNAGIRSRVKKKFKATTNSKHKLAVAPNVLNQGFTAKAADRIWAGDITYIATDQGWLYLAVLLDLFNHKVLGWATSSKINAELVTDALKMALSHRKVQPGLVHHSDRGSQYASADYQQLLAEHGIVCSMSRKGNCYDNAVVESFFSRLKSEWTNHYHYQTRQEAIESLFYYIEIFYNRKRRHASINYVTPQQYDELAVEA
jgi:transposase InsO family protein